MWRLMDNTTKICLYSYLKIMAVLEARKQFPCNICKISIIKTAICFKLFLSVQIIFMLQNSYFYVIMIPINY